APVSAAAVPVKSAAAKGTAATAARTRPVRLLAMLLLQYEVRAGGPAGRTWNCEVRLSPGQSAGCPAGFPRRRKIRVAHRNPADHLEGPGSHASVRTSRQTSGAAFSARKPHSGAARDPFFSSTARAAATHRKSVRTVPLPGVSRP